MHNSASFSEAGYLRQLSSEQIQIFIGLEEINALICVDYISKT